MNAVHTKCGNTVYTDISGTIKILCNFGIGSKSIKHGMGYLHIPSKGQYDAKYYCPACNNNISAGDISLNCSWCGELKPSTELRRLTDRNGKTVGDIICPSCLKLYGNRMDFYKDVPLNKTLENIWLDGE